MNTDDQLLLDSILVAILSWIALYFQKEKLGELRIFVKIFFILSTGSATLIIIVKFIKFIINLISK
jgi:hypothetical protein